MKSDEDLCRDYINGCDQSFTELYHRHKKLVIFRASKLIREKEEAEDAAQVIWEVVARYLKSSFSFECKFTTYLYTIIRTRCINYNRTKNPIYLLTEQSEADYDALVFNIERIGEDCPIKNGYNVLSNHGTLLRQNLIKEIKRKQRDNFLEQNYDAIEGVIQSGLDNLPTDYREIYSCESLVKHCKNNNLSYWSAKEFRKIIIAQVKNRVEELDRYIDN